MTAMNFCELLLRQSLTNTHRAQRWSDASHKVAGVLPEHPILTVDLQQIGRLDCVVGELETDIARLTSNALTPHPMAAFDFCVVLARGWLADLRGPAHNPAADAVDV